MKVEQYWGHYVMLVGHIGKKKKKKCQAVLERNIDNNRLCEIIRKLVKIVFMIPSFLGCRS